MPFVPCTVLKCDVTVHEQCLCPLHSTHMWYYCSLAKKKKKKKDKRGFGNTDPNPPKLLLAYWTSLASYMFGGYILKKKKLKVEAQKCWFIYLYFKKKLGINYFIRNFDKPARLMSSHRNGAFAPFVPPATSLSHFNSQHFRSESENPTQSRIQLHHRIRAVDRSGPETWCWSRPYVITSTGCYRTSRAWRFSSSILTR